MGFAMAAFACESACPGVRVRIRLPFGPVGSIERPGRLGALAARQELGHVVKMLV